MTSPVLHTRQLAVTLDQSPVLAGVDMTLQAGEAVAILGENGSGKSTLLRSLLGLVPITSGRAEIFGVPVGSAAKPWQRIGYVPQRLAPATGIPTTALEVVRTGLLTRPFLRLGRAANAQAHAALDSVGLAQRTHQPVAHMSGGQQQRVAIARALVRDPELLILDEPAAGVDQQRQADLASILADLQVQGRTMLLVLHDLGHFAQVLGRALTLRGGVIDHDCPITHGTPEHSVVTSMAHHPDSPAGTDAAGVLAASPNEWGW